MHLRFDDIDGAFTRISVRIQVTACNQGGEYAVHDPLGHFTPFPVQNQICRHQRTDVSDEEQGSSRQHDFTSARPDVMTVGIQRPRERLVPFWERGLERAVHQSEPVFVKVNFVFSPDGRDRVLTVDDRR